MLCKHRRFVLVRDRDTSGVSGTGTVAEGVRWSDGTVALRWLSETPSTVVWPDLESAMAVHSHDGATRVEWQDEAIDPARRLPETIRMERRGDTCSLTIDGAEFPWHVGADSVSAFVRRDEMPSVSVDLLCTRLEIVNDLSGEGDP